MIRLFLSIRFVFTCLFCESQARPDTTSLIFNAKLNTIRFDNVLIQNDSLGEITVIKVNIQDFPCLRPSDSRVIEVNGIAFTR